MLLRRGGEGRGVALLHLVLSRSLSLRGQPRPRRRRLVRLLWIGAAAKGRATGVFACRRRGVRGGQRDHGAPHRLGPSEDPRAGRVVARGPAAAMAVVTRDCRRALKMRRVRLICEARRQRRRHRRRQRVRARACARARTKGTSRCMPHRPQPSRTCLFVAHGKMHQDKTTTHADFASTAHGNHLALRPLMAGVEAP